DRDLIDKLEEMVKQGMEAMSAPASASPVPAAEAAPVAEAPPLVAEAPVAAVAAPVAEPAKEITQGTLIDQTLERPLRPGEVSLDELER
ncbi:hypothetical protein ABTQ07_20750, partial [Acinetobacter baumannii]